jgi:hypothetical protein
MIMRWVLAIFLVSAGFYLATGITSRHLAIRRILFLTFVFLGLSSLIFQEQWTRLSKLAGVENGTALLTYFVTIAFISNVISSFRWRRRYDEKIAILTRELTLTKSRNQGF